MSKILLVILLILSYTLADSANPFYVEKESIKKTEQQWTLKLLNHNSPSPLDSRNPELMKGAVTIETLDKKLLHLKIVNDTGARFEAPLFNKNPGRDFNPGDMDNMGFVFEEDPFAFQITDPESGIRLLSTRLELGGSLKYYDKLIELGLWYPSRKIFGYGTRSTPDLELCHARDHCMYTIFNADALNPLDEGIPPGRQETYGTHPFYMILLKDGKFMATFFLNANAQEIEITKLNHTDAINLQHRTIGGVIDTYFFYPDTAINIMKRYHDLIGRPYLPPFWALGFHQCRWGWRTLSKVKEVVAKFDEADIPLDTMWADIDYMQDYVDFTIDPIRFKGLPEFVNDLHKKKMRWVPIIDAGLNYSKSNKYIIEGEKNECLIKSALHKGETFIGRVWPGYTAYIDFYAPYASTLWQMGLGDLDLQVHFDGIWLDMNEASNFCDGECFKEDVKSIEIASDKETDPHDPTEFDNLPYVPGGQPLIKKAIDMAAYHHATTPDEERLNKEFNLHSLWGIKECISTNDYLAKTNRRPFIVTRSSYAGSGQYVSVWGGDNYSTWEYMRYSIVTVVTYQMFGMPLSGSDICGFIGHTTEELCARWMQMGSFYPFSRNHNVAGARDQEPYALGERVAMASRNAIRQKYSLLQYYYTKLFEISLDGGSMYSPVFFYYPHDAKVYEDRNNTFMVGDAILVAPALYKGITEVTPYVPNGNWFNLRTREQVLAYKPGHNGTHITLPASFEYVNLLLSGGKIIPYQDALSAKVRRTEALRYLPMELIIAPDHSGFAHGSLIVDEGDSLNVIPDQKYRRYLFNFQKSTKMLSVAIMNNNVREYEFEKFWRVTILGAEDMKNDTRCCIDNMQGFIADLPGAYNEATKALTFQLTRSQIYWSTITKIRFGQDCLKMAH